ncbi:MULTISPECIES: hypothetical protein [Novosphingobium]|uniref:hypothetical protein n=1 Tax=Novosphingobium sp. RL4 TaxID=3109595 RepID=UPI00163D5372|nr:hypothetical protein [Novosphingobium sp. RL4]WRT95915.1 hypothetical protein U9J33_20160 [Novosphingobium sp. RL4]
MGDMIDGFRDMKAIKQAERKVFGLPCPVCVEKLPRAQPKRLQPGQSCQAHKPHYRDHREEPTVAEYNERMAAAGIDIRKLEVSNA